MTISVAHIHFNLRKCSVKESPLDKKKRTAIVELDGTFDDDEQWEVIHKKLIEGVKIYVSEDFKGEIMMAVSEEAAAVARERNLLKIKVESLLRERDTLQAQLEEKNAVLGVLGDALK